MEILMLSGLAGVAYAVLRVPTELTCEVCARPAEARGLVLRRVDTLESHGESIGRFIGC